MAKQKQAIALLKKQEYEAAAKILIEIIDERPDDPVGYVNFGNLLVEINEFEKAANFFNKAIEIDPQFATAYFSLGNLLYTELAYEQAIVCFQKAIELGLEDADVYYMLGMSLCKNKHFIQALPFLQRATELDSDLAILFQYGLLLAQLNFIDDAEKVLLELVNASPDHADALYNLAVIAVTREDNPRAMTYLEKVLEIQPTHQLALDARRNLNSTN